MVDNIFFRIKYKDIFGVSHDYTSQKYATKKKLH